MSEKSNSRAWAKAILPIGSSIQQAINCLENSSLQIVLVVSEEGKLEGTLTDGDIRRAFLKGQGLNSLIDELITRNPLAIPQEVAREHVLNIMKVNNIHQLPIIDNNGRVVGLQVWDEVISPVPVDNLMIIMAGGKGTRMRPHTENCPKPMLEISGKPMLQHIIERAAAEGFQNFIISLHYLGHIIVDYFGDGSKYGVKINYLNEKEPLGTAGCLSLLPKPPEKPFLVTNGDVLTDISYGEFLNFHVTHNAIATMAVKQYEIQNQYGVVLTNGIEIDGFEEKPIYRSHVNAGMYVLNSDSLKHLAPGLHCDMPTLFERIQKNSGRTIVYPMHEPWLDVGRPEDLINATRATKY